MIIRHDPDGLHVVLQTDHAALSGELARHWGNDRFDPPSPFESVVLAAEGHDEGWRDWEAHPQVDPRTRRPYQFTAMDLRVHHRFYGAGVRRIAARDRYAGLLVSMHSAGLYEKRFGTNPQLSYREVPDEARPEIDAYLEEQRTLQNRLRAQLAGDPPILDAQVWTNYRLLQAWDLLSLFFCLRRLERGESTRIPRVPVRYGSAAEVELLVDVLRPASGSDASGPAVIGISPFPFATSPLRLRLAARSLEDRDYADDADLERALASADPRLDEFELRRP